MRLHLAAFTRILSIAATLIMKHFKPFSVQIDRVASRDGALRKRSNWSRANSGGTPPVGELELLSSRLIDPGPWLTLIHGDPCPDNSLLVGGRIRLIDYEFRSTVACRCLMEFIGEIGFPTCWCAGRTRTMLPPVSMRPIRMELGSSIPLALDDTASSHRIRLHMSAVSALHLSVAATRPSTQG